MKRIKRIFLAVLIAIVLIGSISVSAASASSSMSYSASSLTQGDTLTVTVSISSDTPLYNVQGFLDYNSSVLEYSGGGISASGGSVMIMHGSMELDAQAFTSDSVTVTFTAVGAGDSPLSYYVTDNSTENFEVISISGCSSSVSVSGQVYVPEDEPDTEIETETETEIPEEEEKPEEEIFATIDGVQYKIWQDYEGIELPDGFGPYIFEYNNQQCEGAVDGSGRVRIAYLENTKTGYKGFYIFFNDEFMPFIHVNAVASSYTLYPLEEGVKVPKIFDQQVDNFRGGTIPVWKSSDERLEGRILIYATAPGGERGFFLYDEATATVQRFVQINYEDPIEEEVVEEKEEVTDKAQSLYAKIIEDKEIFTIIAVLAALSLSLLIACIFLFSVRRSKRADKEKFEKKMDRKKARFEKRAEKYMSSGSMEQGEITIETENFDEMTEEASVDQTEEKTEV